MKSALFKTVYLNNVAPIENIIVSFLFFSLLYSIV